MPSNDASKRGITQFLGEILDFNKLLSREATPGRRRTGAGG